ncbi:MAG: type II toxin-antitoxin system HicB family antitoxin [Puniceicoccales bacterium]|jgi:predicted RNase H-like HicB family nuclease|nr:type II toxin-antitoxin system HicB family antitoxin [Puniceicoccales bacterium]
MKNTNQIPDPSRYAVNLKWSEDDEGFLATVPAIPSCLCVMPTEAAALREIRLLIKSCLELFVEDGNPIPEPDGGERSAS